MHPTIIAFNQKCAWLALFFLTLCFYASAFSVSLTSITYLIAFACVLLSGQWRQKWHRIQHNPAAWSFWLLSALMIIGIFYSTATPHHIVKAIQKMHWLFITPFFMMLVINEQWRKRMINGFLGVMIFTVLLSMIKGIFHPPFLIKLPYQHPHMGVGIFYDHIVQSFAMNIAAFMCAYRFLFHKKNRLGYAILFAVMTLNILFFSIGRTGYLIFFVLLAYLCYTRFQWKGLLIGALVCLILMSAAFVSSVGFRARTNEMFHQYAHYNQQQQINPINQRLEMYAIAKRMIVKRPWFGYGTGGIATALPSVIPAADRIYNPQLNYVESIYLNILLGFGVVGFLIFMVAMIVQIKATFNLPHEYRFLMQVVLISVLIGGLFNSFFVSFSVAHFYALFSGLCFGIKSHHDN